MSRIEFTPDTPGLSEVPGFRVGFAAADVRGKGGDRPDVAVLHSQAPCAVAGVFTRNAAAAAPVLICRERLASSRIPLHGFVANSGNANACTGPRGRDDTLAMAARAEIACGAPAGSFLVCSTGRIGERLPLDRLLPGIDGAAAALDTTTAAGQGAATAILTSDTRPKTATARFAIGGKTVTLAGMAKGAGMIQPDMATMLAFLATDAVVAAPVLDVLLRRAVASTFNAITVDGDTSTNDTVLLFTGGASGVAINPDTDPDGVAVFAEALEKVCACLAEKIVADGERTSRVVELMVEGAATGHEAERIARCIGNSLLVKASWAGGDPNWGRLVDAAGYAGAALELDRLELDYDDVPVLRAGEAQAENKLAWKKVVARPRFTIRLRLGLGDGAFRLLATDITEGYISYNKSE
ncbi:MAG: bifunctional glutamate N-acetyltransferase/amino-acid acetyltransferase ArgJ [Puniceicoccaceae bacterium]|nr:MAG: bifunctional glutamate N-acetyltransferase/amino-acid acetyltransferase ArgJ [Puniceicoccaceae bacterium]